MTNQLFEAALGIKAPWYVQSVDFDAGKRQLTIAVDFVAGSRFGYASVAGEHPVHDTQIKRLRHLNFFQHECYLEVRVPRVRLPDGSVRLVEPDWVGQLSGFTLLFEALVLMLAQQMPFAAVARIVNLSWHRVHAICSRYVELALASADLSEVTTVAIDETSYRRGHEYLTLVADMQARRVVFVTTGKDASTIERFAAYLGQHGGKPEQVGSVSIDMSPAFIKGVNEHLPDARLTFDKFHVVAHASKALDTVRRQQQKVDPELKGMRWTLLKDAKTQSGPTDRPRGARQSVHHQPHGTRLAVSRATARNSRAQANQCRLRDVATVVHQRHALEGRTDEGRGAIDSPTLRRHRRLDPDPPDQRLHRSHQRSVSGRQAQGARIRSLRNHANGPVSHRRQTRLLRIQLACPLKAVTHSVFKRAQKELLDSLAYACGQVALSGIPD